MLIATYLILAQPLWNLFWKRGEHKHQNLWGNFRELVPKNWWHEQRYSRLAIFALVLIAFIFEVCVMTLFPVNAHAIPGWAWIILLPEMAAGVGLLMHCCGWVGATILFLIFYPIRCIVNYLQKKDEELKNK